MQQYIGFVADRLLVALGNPRYYRVANPFDFMDIMSLPGDTNFFEKRVSDHSNANVRPATTVNSWDTSSKVTRVLYVYFLQQSVAHA